MIITNLIFLSDDCIKCILTNFCFVSLSTIVCPFFDTTTSNSVPGLCYLRYTANLTRNPEKITSASKVLL